MPDLDAGRDREQPVRVHDRVDLREGRHVRRRGVGGVEPEAGTGGGPTDQLGQRAAGGGPAGRAPHRTHASVRGRPRRALGHAGPRIRDDVTARHLEVQRLGGGQLGRRNSDCILIASPISPLILSLPCMKAAVPSSLPVMILTQSPESASNVSVGGVAGSPLPDSALPSWMWTHHFPLSAPLRSKTIVAFVLPAFSGMRNCGIASTIWSGVI